MAKGLEDTACYVYNRFVSVNEVGGSPAEFGISLERVPSRQSAARAALAALMLATSTHDTKRSEDVRARLDVLSEMPRTGRPQVMKWRRINRTRKIADLRWTHRARQQRRIPALPDAGGRAGRCGWTAKHELQEFVARIQQYMEKAVHEAKVNLSWLNPNPEYVAALNAFVESILSPQPAGQDKSVLGHRCRSSCRR